MWKVAFALALLAVSARADFIDTNTQSIDTSTAVGRHVDFDTTLNLDQFNPALGTLNSVDFRFNFAGNIFWQVLSQPSGPSLYDFGYRGHATFLGVEAFLSDGPVLGHGFFGICGVPGKAPGEPPFPYPWAATCTPANSLYNGNGGYQFTGVINNGSSSVHSDTHTASPMLGTLPTLDGFIGASQLALPVALSIDGFPNALPVQMGDFVGSQQNRASLYVTYNYTPSPINVAPEPRLAGMLVVLCAALFTFRRRSLSV